jgi:hypothetical protein
MKWKYELTWEMFITSSWIALGDTWNSEWRRGQDLIMRIDKPLSYVIKLM